MRIIFLGSPEFALPTLRSLLESQHDLVAVVTQPDRPAGRGHATRPPPVKQLAVAAGLPVLQPERVSEAESVSQLRTYEPDALVVAAYGQILRRRLLDLPRRGSLNVHASLLPRWRGASPVSGALLAGDTATGVTIMEMVRALDAGPIVAQRAEPIGNHDTTGSLEQRLAALGADLLMEVLDAWGEGQIPATPQTDNDATYAGQLHREDALIDWDLPAVDIWRRVRAFNPWPGAFARTADGDLKVWHAWPVAEDSGFTPGTILQASPIPASAGIAAEAPKVQTGKGCLFLLEVQLAGRRPVTGSDFVRGRSGLLGSRLEAPG